MHMSMTCSKKTPNRMHAGDSVLLRFTISEVTVIQLYMLVVAIHCLRTLSQPKQDFKKLPCIKLYNLSHRED